MNVRLVKQYRFEAAHRLQGLHAEHPCGGLHGHSYVLELALEGPVNETTGWLVDFAELDSAAKCVCTRLDHSFLNDIAEIGNPTCENLCRWIWAQLKPDLPMLCKVTVWETHDARCEYEGN